MNFWVSTAAFLALVRTLSVQFMPLVGTFDFVTFFGGACGQYTTNGHLVFAVEGARRMLSAAVPYVQSVSHSFSSFSVASHNAVIAASRMSSLIGSQQSAGAEQSTRTEQSAAEPEPAPAEDGEDEPDAYYGKFDSGFEGTFADMSDYFGGLERMIGDCRKDLMAAMEEEHCDVAEGFGASDTEFSTSSYRVITTPREEWNFVVNPGQTGDMSAGIDRDLGAVAAAPSRLAVDARRHVANLARVHHEVPLLARSRDDAVARRAELRV